LRYNFFIPCAFASLLTLSQSDGLSSLSDKAHSRPFLPNQVDPSLFFSFFQLLRRAQGLCTPRPLNAPLQPLFQVPGSLPHINVLKKLPPPLRSVRRHSFHAKSCRIFPQGGTACSTSSHPSMAKLLTTKLRAPSLYFSGADLPFRSLFPKGLVHPPSFLARCHYGSFFSPQLSLNLRASRAIPFLPHFFFF